MLKQKSVSLLLMILSFIIISCDKKGDATPAVVPAVKIDDASQVRGTTATVMHFSVTLNKVTTVPGSVDYVMTDGTATSPKDYTAASGTINIAAGQSIAEISVQIKGDPSDTRQNNLEFTVQLSNPKACTLGNSSAKGIIITENGTNFITDNAGYTTSMSYPGYTLVWNDEFSGTTLDANSWNYEIGNGSGGWGNNELEYYTNSTKNSFVSNGNLIIEARQESISGFNYSSARLTTQNKKTFTYGRVDIRAKLPRTKGIWAALWTLGSNISTVGWPTCGEADIMELLGQEPNKTYGTLHFGNSGNHGQKGSSYTLPSGSFSDQFHVFSMQWKQNEVKLYMDDILFLTVTNADVVPYTYPFNAPLFFIFNVAVGGNWPGSPDGTTSFPQRMIVDYIRVYQ